MTRWSIAFPILSLIALTCAAQDVPPPPKPADDGPSLTDTMKFIEEKLGSIGRVNYVWHAHDDANGTDEMSKFGVEISNVRTSVQGCRIDYHKWLNWERSSLFEKDAWVALKNVQEVVVETREHAFNEFDSKAGHPERTSRVDPPVFVIRAREKIEHQFYLYDESLAHRIAKALVHAVELCGGGSKEPF
jgi:hypothetical protein